MQLEHDFTVPVPPAQAWDVLLDLEQVAPCMPGATIESIDGDEFTGKVKVKVGPITVTYQGSGKITEKDAAGLRAVIVASGKEARGSGTASATVTAQLEPHGDGATRVAVTTDLAITGRPAQFGRGVMTEVGAKLIGIFADCLAGKLAAEPSASAEEAVDEAVEESVDEPAPPTAAPAAAPVDVPAPAAEVPKRTYTRPPGVPEDDAIDLLDVAGPSLMKRVAPIAVAVLAAIVFLIWRRRR